jgi:hypothetical protein
MHPGCALQRGTHGVRLRLRRHEHGPVPLRRVRHCVRARRVRERQLRSGGGPRDEPELSARYCRGRDQRLFHGRDRCLQTPEIRPRARREDGSREPPRRGFQRHYACAHYIGWGESILARSDIDPVRPAFWAQTSNVFAAPVAGGSAVPIALATEPFGLAVDAANVYWTDTAIGQVMKMPKSGGTPVVLSTGGFSPLRITVDAANVYFSSSDGPLRRVPIAGGPTVAVTSVAVTAADIAVDGANLYWTGAGAGLAPGVYRVPLAGGTLVRLASSLSNEFANGLALDSAFVYWTEGDILANTGRVRRLGK